MKKYAINIVDRTIDKSAAETWFDLNGNDIEYVLPDAPGDFMLTRYDRPRFPGFKTRLYLHIACNSPDEYKLLLNLAEKNFLVITNGVDSQIQHERIVYNDFLFNRTKAYYTGYNFRPDTKLWLWSGADAYKTMPLSQAQDKQRIFTAPNKSYENHGWKYMKFWRRKLIDFLLPYQDIGYMGVPDKGIGLSLYTQLDLVNDEPVKDSSMLQYCPPHNMYYQRSFISIYGESVETGTGQALTEKTYDPMLKGHFVLPFASAGTVDLIRKKGLLLPDFIDYSYDVIHDDQKRFDTYCDEVKRLLSFSMDHWCEFWRNNTHILAHNQQWFNRDYERVDLDPWL